MFWRTHAFINLKTFVCLAFVHTYTFRMKSTEFYTWGPRSINSWKKINVCNFIEKDISLVLQSSSYLAHTEWKQKHKFLQFSSVPVGAVLPLIPQSYLACGTSMLEETTLRFCSSRETERVWSFSGSSARPVRLCSSTRGSSVLSRLRQGASPLCTPPFWPCVGPSRWPPLQVLCREKHIWVSSVLTVFIVSPRGSRQWSPIYTYGGR